jgi:hypothetical protein
VSAKQLESTLSIMYEDIDTDKLSEKYGTMSNDDLLKEYRNDDDYELSEELSEKIMESKANVKPEFINNKN